MLMCYFLLIGQPCRELFIVSRPPFTGFSLVNTAFVLFFIRLRRCFVDVGGTVYIVLVAPLPLPSVSRHTHRLGHAQQVQKCVLFRREQPGHSITRQE